MADLTMFATKDNADEGILFPVKIDGTKLPIAIKIYGSDSDVVKDYERDRIRQLGKMQKKGKGTVDDEIIDEYLDTQDEGVIVRIGGVYSWDWKKSKVIENDPIVINGKTVTNDREGYEYLIEKLPAVKDWVLEISNERNNFLSNGKKN